MGDPTGYLEYTALESALQVLLMLWTIGALVLSMAISDTHERAGGLPAVALLVCPGLIGLYWHACAGDPLRLPGDQIVALLALSTAVGWFVIRHYRWPKVYNLALLWAIGWAPFAMLWMAGERLVPRRIKEEAKRRREERRWQW